MPYNILKGLKIIRIHGNREMFWRKNTSDDKNVIESIDETKLKYESPLLAHTCKSDTYKYLTWDSVPEIYRNNIKNDIRQIIMTQNPHSPLTTEIYVRGFLYKIKTVQKLNLAVLIKYAISEIFKEENITTPHILTTNGKGWFIYFIQGGKKDTIDIQTS